MNFRCDGMARQIFISYSRKDKEFTQQLSKDLIDAGHEVWFDPSLKAGEDWESVIETKIKESDQVIVILSSNSLGSKWVQHEGSMAYGLNKRIYPLLIEPVESNELPLWSRKYQNHNFVDIPYDEALLDFIEALIPPNPIQDLLDQQVNLFEESKMLLSRSMLKLFNQNIEKLEINDKARELFNRSEFRLSNDVIFPPFVSILLMLIGYSFLFQDQFQLRPMDMQYVFWPLVIFYGYLGFRRGWYRELLNTTSIILLIFIFVVGEDYIFPHLTIEPSLVEFLGLCIFLIYSITSFDFLEERNSASTFFMKINRRTEGILSILLGLANGYLLSGSIWFYLHKISYDFPIFIMGSSENLPMDYMTKLENFVQYMPPAFLGDPVIYIMVAFVFAFVLIVYI